MSRTCVTPHCHRPAQRGTRCSTCRSNYYCYGDWVHTVPTRLPWSALQTWLDTKAGQPLTPEQTALRIGVDPGQIYGWIKKGKISGRQADRFAVHLGVHPYAIWGDDWWADLLADIAAEHQQAAAG